MYLNNVIGVLPAYVKSTVTNYKTESITRTGLEFLLQVTYVWFYELPHALPNLGIINIESERRDNSCKLVGKMNHGRKL